MYHTNFVHLHVHSHYSLLDGAAPVKDLVAAARRFRMPALAITDHGNMFGAIDFYQTAIKHGVKPIIGFESYLAPCKRTEKTPKDAKDFHLVLLARNHEGYKNLVRLSSLAYIEGMYYRPRIDQELLEKYHTGIIALGACLQGEVPQKLLHGDQEGAKAAVRRYQELFGKENYYLEVMDHGLPEQRELLPNLVRFARELEVPIVATNDSHYLNPEDWEAHEALLCIQTRTTLSDEKRFRFGSREFYFKSPQQMTDLFHELPDAIENTIKIAEQCNVRFDLGKSILPHFPIPPGKTSESYLDELCQSSLHERYPNPDETVMKRLEFELSVIRKMGFCEYFLIVWDFIRHSRSVGVPVGPGRGSAAGSIVAFLLKITDIDPLKYRLLFERFLNPDRISMPDIDIDFADDGRGKIIDYVVEKYGRERVSQIVTFSCILAKTAIRDIGRVMGLPLSDVDRIAKLVPEKPGIHLKACLKGGPKNEIPDLKEIWEKGTPDQKRLLQNAMTIDGLYRHSGIHAAGVVISRDELMDIVPMFKDKSQEIVTQFEKNAIEKIGLLKMDFLGLKTLTIIQRALDYIKETQGVEVDFSKLPYEDKPTYELLCKGLTQGVFQLESSGMRSLITRLKPSVFEDIIALLAMYRPGPLGSGMVDDFVERKHGRKILEYPHPDLEPILRDTYGVFLYQEQCMQTANVLAGFTMGQADGLRKAMAKKIAEDMERLGKLFVDGAVKRGIPREKAQSIFDLMASFGEYGFNKSHSAAYAVLTFRTAYLKTHFPVEFMAAVLSSELNDTDKIAIFIDECRALNIPILKPELNKSRELFSVENGSIRFGLSAIKGVGDKAIASIITARTANGQFKSLTDFTRRIDTRVVNNQVVEALINSGAMDSFGLRRSQLAALTTDALRSGQKLQKERLAGQATFFDLLGTEAETVMESEQPPPDIPEFSERDLLDAEKKTLGFYLTGDPFGEVAPLGRVFSTLSLSDLAAHGEGKICRIAGLLTAFKKHPTKKGDVMAFLTLEADNVSIDVTVFPGVYTIAASKFVVDEPLFLVVRPVSMNDEVKVIAEKILTLSDLQIQDSAQIRFLIPPEMASKNNYLDLMKILRRNPGPSSFTIQIALPTGEKAVLKPPPLLRVALGAALVKDWEKVCGRGSVKALFPQLEIIKERNNRGSWNHNDRKYS